MGLYTEQVEIQSSHTLQSLLYYVQIMNTDKVQTMLHGFIHFMGYIRDRARRLKASNF